MRIKLPFTLFHKVIEGLCFLVFLGSLIYLAVNWRFIPDSVPTHFNAAGAADAWGGKNSLIILIAVDAMLYIVMTLASLFPASWNVPVRITPENSLRVLPLIKDMLSLTKLYILVMFGYLIVAASRAMPLGAWFLPLVLVLLLGTNVAYIILARRAAKGL